MEETDGFFSLNISHEELVVLLRMFRADTIVGLEENPLRGLDEGQAAEALAAGERSLRARGLVNIIEDENRIEVEPMTLVLLGTCLFPLTTLAALRLDKDGEVTPVYYHCGDTMLVELSFPGNGVYLLTTSTDKDTMLSRASNFLEPKVDADFNDAEYEIPASALEELRELVSTKKQDQAAETMRVAGVPAKDADNLVRMFDESNRNCLLMRADYREDGAIKAVDGLALLESDHELWLVTSANPVDEKLRIKAISKKEALERIEELLTRQSEGALETES